MKKRINILFIFITVLSIASCSTRRPSAGSRPPAKSEQAAKSKQSPKKSQPGYSNQTVSKLSKQFGIRLTQADHIALYTACSSWIGVKYRYGGNTKNGVDCSGFVSAIYKQVYGTGLERNSANILRRNCTAVRKNNLREGDLVFFKTTGSGNRNIPTHVGIYLKNGRFIHAASSRGVAVNSLSEAYYVRTWITGGRVKK
ncbi:MAG: C40 family peptidase [Tannerella sp.]|jgi:lipoprotein Spr|nr:C40 family peptidase [Tannerella sp.]